MSSSTSSASSSSSLSSSSSNRHHPLGSPKSIYEMIMSSSPELSSSTTRHYQEEAALHPPIPRSNDQNLANPNKNNNSNNSSYSLDQLTRQSLPFFLPWYATAGPASMPPDFSYLTNSCGGKAAIGVFGGGMMGLLMGVFLGAMSDATPPVTIIAGKDVPQAPLKEQVRVTFRATWEKSLYWCRNFAFITGVFGGSECLVEKYRGKSDVWNSVASGCITGAALQAKQGPQAAALGCGGFAAFSLVIDSVMGHY